MANSSTDRPVNRRPLRGSGLAFSLGSSFGGEAAASGQRSFMERQRKRLRRFLQEEKVELAVAADASRRGRLTGLRERVGGCACPTGAAGVLEELGTAVAVRGADAAVGGPLIRSLLRLGCSSGLVAAPGIEPVRAPSPVHGGRAPAVVLDPLWGFLSKTVCFRGGIPKVIR